MVPIAWCPSEAALKGRHECALSEVSTRPDMTLDVARTQNDNKQTVSGNVMFSSDCSSNSCVGHGYIGTRQ